MEPSEQSVQPVQEDQDLRWVQVRPSSKVLPPVMFGHTAVVWENSMYLFAGYSMQYLPDLFHFDFVAGDWNNDTRIKSELPDGLVGRQYHSAVVYDDRMWVLMGAGPGAVLKEFFTYDFRTHAWTNVPINDDFPPVRYLQTAVVYKDAMWIFGGKINTYSNDCINDIHCYDFKTMKWTEIQVPLHPRPAQRRTHSAVVHHDCMYIFSGWNGADYFDDLWEFNFESRRWSEVITHGDKPTGRQLHSGVMYDGDMWVFGGFDTTQYFDQLFKFNFETYTWTKFNLEPRPCARNAHTAVVYDGAMYIVGGNNFFDDINSLWKLEFPKSRRFTLLELYENDMHQLLTSKRMADVQLKINGKEKMLHRCVLLARCPTLLKMIDEGRHVHAPIFLGEEGEELLESVLEFLYTDRLQVFRKADWETLFEVLDFAQAIEFPQLTNACEYLISKRARIDLISDIKERAKTPQLSAWCAYFAESTIDMADPSVLVPLLFEPKEEAMEEVRLTFNASLTADMLRLYTDALQPDMVIATQRREFPVHRALLLSRCPYFEGLLRFNRDASSSRIDHDLKITEEDFETILKFIYSSEIHFQVQNFFSLVAEASFYMVDSDQFYDACFEHFQLQVTVNNISQLCLQCEHMDMPSVKQFLFDFIAANWLKVRHHILLWPDGPWKKEIVDRTKLYDLD